MESAVLSLLGKVAFGKLVDYIANLFKRGKLNFYDASLVYQYSFYDQQGNHTRNGGTEKIYEVLFGLQMYNSSSSPRIMRDFNLIGNIGGSSYRFNSFDFVLSKWENSYNIPAKSLTKISCCAIPEGHGRLPGHPGIIRFNLEDRTISFKLHYIDERNKKREISINSIKSARLNPRFIGV